MREGKNGQAARKPGRVVQVPMFQLHPSPENETIYRGRTTGNADFARLVESIRRHGVQTPLLVSQDNYIISGHQRRQAAIAAGVREVPVLYLKISRKDHTSDQWMAVLREHNTGRERTFDELVREKLIDVDPDEAIAQIVDDEAKRTQTRVASIDISHREMKRDGISEVKRGMVDAVLEVLRDLKEFLPVSLRAVHYRLLVKTFFRNAKSRTPYRNDPASYKDLSDLATRMRVAGRLPWDWLCDETRPTSDWRCWKNAGDFVGDECEGFLKGYSRDLLQSQPMHFEVVVEKLTVQNFVDAVAMKYCMPVVVMRGNSGIDARHQMVKRYRASGKDRLYVLCLGDCDPDGDSIVETTLCSLRDDFRVRDVEGTRVAMTHAQADALHLPRMLEAKVSSSNHDAFVEKHGRTDCYELEAVAPEVQQGWLDEAIRGVLDLEAYNHEVRRQTEEATQIMARRQAILEVLRR
jgi:hypothetical protein